MLSSAARAMCAAVDPRVSPRIAPRAYGSQCGLPSPGERRHQVDAAVVGDARRERLDVGRRPDDAEPVAQPLHHRAGDEDAAFQRVLGVRSRCGTPPWSAACCASGTGRSPGVHQHEAAGAVGILGHAGRRCSAGRTARPAGRPPCRRSGCGRRGYRPWLSATRPLDALTSGSICRGTRNKSQQFLVPAAGVDVEEQRARGVGLVGDVRRAARELPDEPGIDRAERELARLAPPRARPARCRVSTRAWCRKNRRRAPARSSPSRAPRGRAPSARRRRPPCAGPARRSRCRPARPVARSHTTVVSRWLVMPIAATSRALMPGARDGLARDRDLRRPDLLRVVLDPARLRKMLGEFLLRHRANGARRVENDGARTGRALV